MIRRRDFVRSAMMAGTALAASRVFPASAWQPKRTFRLNYAPHFGMFRQHAGEDLVAQLEFMAAQGFTGLEDNGLRGRTPDVQEQIGKTLARLTCAWACSSPIRSTGTCRR